MTIEDEIIKDAETWRHVLKMVRANGFESVAGLLCEVDKLRKERKELRDRVTELENIVNSYRKTAR